MPDGSYTSIVVQANKIILLVMISCLGLCCESQAKGTMGAQSPIRFAEVRNCNIYVPNIGHGSNRRVKFKDGEYTLKNNNSLGGCEAGTISCIAAGKFNGAPAAVALLTWSGGNGLWHQVLLFRRINGKVVSREYAELASVAYSAKFTFANNMIHSNQCHLPARLKDFELYDRQCFYKLEKNTPALTVQEIMRSSIVLPNNSGSTDKWQLKNGVCKTEKLSCRLEQVVVGTCQDAPIAVAFAKTNMRGKHHLILLYGRGQNGSGVSCLGYMTLPEGSSVPYSVSGLTIADESVDYNIVGYSFTQANFTKCRIN